MAGLGQLRCGIGMVGVEEIRQFEHGDAPFDLGAFVGRVRTGEERTERFARRVGHGDNGAVGVSHGWAASGPRFSVDAYLAVAEQAKWFGDPIGGHFPVPPEALLHTQAYRGGEFVAGDLLRAEWRLAVERQTPVEQTERPLGTHRQDRGQEPFERVLDTAAVPAEHLVPSGARRDGPVVVAAEHRAAGGVHRREQWVAAPQRGERIVDERQEVPGLVGAELFALGHRTRGVHVVDGDRPPDPHVAQHGRQPIGRGPEGNRMAGLVLDRVDEVALDQPLRARVRIEPAHQPPVRRGWHGDPVDLDTTVEFRVGGALREPGGQRPMEMNAGLKPRTVIGERRSVDRARQIRGAGEVVPLPVEPRQRRHVGRQVDDVDRLGERQRIDPDGHHQSVVHQPSSPKIAWWIGASRFAAS